MLYMRILTDTSWIFEDENNEKLGIITLDNETEQYLLVTPTMKFNFSNIYELGDMLDSQISEVQSNRPIVKDFKEINGFPIPCEDPKDIREEDELVIYKEVDGGIDWVAGYWVYCTANVWKHRSGIKKTKIDTDKSIKGPYKSKMEAQFLANTLNKEE